MTLDGQAEHIYSSLDDNGLLALLLVLRNERDRHMRMMVDLGRAYREAVGPHAPPITSVGEMVERIDAARAQEPDAVSIMEFMQATEASGLLHDTDHWQAFSVTYPVNLARREQWVLDELTRRGLLPAMDQAAEGPGE